MMLALLTKWAGHAAVLAAISTVALLAYWTSDRFSDSLYEVTGGTIALALAVVLPTAVNAQPRMAGGVIGLIRAVLPIILLALLFMGVMWLTISTSIFETEESWQLAEVGLLLLAAATLTLLLRNLGGQGGALAEPLAWGASMAIIAISSIDLYGGVDGVVVPLVSATLFAWLTPTSQARIAARLAAVSPIFHARVVRRELQRRTMRSAERQLYANARSQLSSGEISVEQFDTRRRELNKAAGPPHNLSTRHITLERTAFGSGAGRSPWQNALAGVVACTILGLPIVALQLYNFSREEGFYLDTETAVFILRALRWVAYGMLFGYFYTRIHGRDPITKSMYFALAIMPAELWHEGPAWPPFFTVEITPETWYGTAIIVGYVSAFSVGLGLFWEYRLMRLAELPWSLLRNVRNARSLAVPSATILTAAAVAAAATFAGAAAEKVFDRPRTAVSPTISQSP